MIVGLLGRLFRAVGRVLPDGTGGDLEHVGEELLRLEQRRAQIRTTSR